MTTPTRIPGIRVSKTTHETRVKLSPEDWAQHAELLAMQEERVSVHDDYKKRVSRELTATLNDLKAERTRLAKIVVTHEVMTEREVDVFVDAAAGRLMYVGEMTVGDDGFVFGKVLFTSSASESDLQQARAAEERSFSERQAALFPIDGGKTAAPSLTADANQDIVSEVELVEIQSVDGEPPVVGRIAAAVANAFPDVDPLQARRLVMSHNDTGEPRVLGRLTGAKLQLGIDQLRVVGAVVRITRISGDAPVDIDDLSERLDALETGTLDTAVSDAVPGLIRLDDEDDDTFRHRALRAYVVRKRAGNARKGLVGTLAAKGVEAVVEVDDESVERLAVFLTEVGKGAKMKTIALVRSEGGIESLGTAKKLVDLVDKGESQKLGDYTVPNAVRLIAKLAEVGSVATTPDDDEDS
jgi:hypothetical protein